MEIWKAALISAIISVILTFVIREITDEHFHHFYIFLTALVGFYVMEFLEIKNC